MNNSTQNSNQSVDNKVPLTLDQAKEILYEDQSRHWLKTHGKSQFIDFSDEERKKLKVYFGELDDDDSGVLGIEELDYIFISLGLAKNRAEVQKALAGVDKDGSGHIEFNEFCSIVSSDGEDNDAPIFKVFKALMEGKMGEGSLSFPMVISTYRRKMFLDAMMAMDPKRAARGKYIMSILKAAHEAKTQRDAAESHELRTQRLAQISKMKRGNLGNRHKKKFLNSSRKLNSTYSLRGSQKGTSKGTNSEHDNMVNMLGGV